ncbi:MAG TPA: PQQ-binding-like beta-propeller repeat protein [Hyphomonadaceae bacterium]|nr:PQQ-binding-like beta-propeller repeat protein [Hyphomonadaceae bacterium]
MRAARWVSLGAIAASIGLAMLSGCAEQRAPDAPAPTAVVDAKTDAAALGQATYTQNCAACHENSTATGAPDRATLARMAPGQIVNAMMTGKMIAQAAPLSSEQVSLVAEYLSDVQDVGDEWINASMCPLDRRTPGLSATPAVSTFGFDLANSRELSNTQAGLQDKDFDKLELAWTVAFPQTVSMRSQAAVVGNTLFLPAGEYKNRLFAFDVSDREKPCIQWVYEGDKALRSSAGYGVRADGRQVILVGDVSAQVHMIDAKTGSEVWAASIALFAGSIATGTPVLVGNKVIAPVSQYEIMMAGYDAHLCCKTHGGVVALDAMTGKRVWEAHTMEDAKPLKDRGDGQMLWGPSGAPVWNSPSIDLKRGQFYIGTGEATSPPAHANTDALMAIGLADGKVRWSHQATANDIYIGGCSPTGAPRQGSTRLNCVPEVQTVYRDVDFGASTIIARTASGRDMVLGGQKSGTVWAMDPDSGKIIWRTDLGTGGPGGGVHWGIAADDTHVYAPISSPGKDIPGQKVPASIKHGIYALNLESGKVDWAFHVEPGCSEEARQFVPRCDAAFGLSGAPTVVGNRVIVGGQNGMLYVLDKTTGKLVWSYNTARAYTGIGGIQGNGASIDNASIVAVNGLLIVNSGYGVFGVGPGNVMLAFKPSN